MNARRIGRLTGGLLSLLTLAAPAAAQDSKEIPWSDVPTQPPNKTRPYITWGVGTLFIIGCLFLAMKNPHRGHLD